MEQEVMLQQLRRIRAEVDSFILALEGKLPEAEGREIAWGDKVSTQFKAGVIWIEEKLGLNADHLMACMAFETGGTFRADIKNAAGSSGLGLIQFMKATHAGMVKKYPSLAKVAPTHADLAKLSAHQQLTFVYYYFLSYRGDYSQMTLEDIYMTILFPKAVGKPNDWAMPWKYGELAYKQNVGLDKNKDKTITKAEASAGVQRMLALGLQQKG